MRVAIAACLVLAACAGEPSAVEPAADAVATPVSAPQAPPLKPGGAAGERAPDFALQDHRGDRVTLSGLLAKGPVIALFYRGYW